jgi:hypothetical protein
MFSKKSSLKSNTDKILVETKYWRLQNIGFDNMLEATKYWQQQNTGGDKTLAATKHWRLQNIGIDKIFCHQNIGVNSSKALTKCWRMRRSPAKPAAAYFSQASLMFSYFILKMLSSPPAVTNCAVATDCPAFMG